LTKAVGFHIFQLIEADLKEGAMRIFFIASLLLTLSPLIGTSAADEVYFCQKGCLYDKRSNDLNCPPAGGSSSGERKQCLEKNVATYNDCLKRCTPPSAKPDESGDRDQQDKDRNGN